MAVDASVLAISVVLSVAGLCAPADMPWPGLGLFSTTCVHCWYHGGCLFGAITDLSHISLGDPSAAALDLLDVA